MFLTPLHHLLTSLKVLIWVYSASWPTDNDDIEREHHQLSCCNVLHAWRWPLFSGNFGFSSDMLKSKLHCWHTETKFLHLYRRIWTDQVHPGRQNWPRGLRTTLILQHILPERNQSNIHLSRSRSLRPGYNTKSVHVFSAGPLLMYSVIQSRGWESNHSTVWGSNEKQQQRTAEKLLFSPPAGVPSAAFPLKAVGAEQWRMKEY